LVKLWKILGFAVSVLLVAGCASVQTQEPATKPPPQNLLGSTDQLQLVVELSLDLAIKHGTEHLLVVLALDDLLLTEGKGTAWATRSVRTVEDNAAQQVERLQDAGIKVIVLSQRGPQALNQTVLELQQNNFNFQRSAWPPQAGYSQPFTPQGADHPVAYQNGVFLTAGQDNGIMLQALLEKSSAAEPVLMIIADKKQSNLNKVMKAFSWTNTKVHAWLYTRETPVLAMP